MKNTASLLISCLDKKWIVSNITEFLFKNNFNISNLEQHIEDWMFFMRVEFSIDENFFILDDFFNNFFEIKEKFWMKIKLNTSNNIKTIWIFCSKELHCLVDILWKYRIWELNIKIAYVVSNFEDCWCLVKSFWIPFYYIPAKKWSFDYEDECLEVIRNNSTDFIVLARYMKILSKNFITEVNQKIINVHHSFLPSFIWANPYKEAYERWVKLIWATSHYVIPELDEWPIIQQTTKRINHAYNIENLKLIWRESEKYVFDFAIKKHIENKLIEYKNKVIVFN